jgi:hypothetical protein
VKAWNGKIPKSPQERFWAFVDQRDQRPEACWLWRGHRGGNTSDAYGRFTFGGVTYMAHRLAYQWRIGPIPAGYVIDHVCGTRLCCRPSHLEAVPQSVNVKRGRYRPRPSGQRSGQAALFEVEDDQL